MSNLAKVVSKVAPLLGSALGGIGAPLGLLVSGIAGLFGADPTSEEDIISKISASPEAALKLKQFELEHQFDLENIIAADRTSARLHEVEVTKAIGRQDWIRPFLVVTSTLLFGSLCFIIAFTTADASDRDLFYMLIGSLNTVWAGSIIGYYFGGFYKLPKEPKKDPPSESLKK